VLVFSDGVDRGSEFTVRLPLLRSSTAEEPQSESTPPHSAMGGAPRRILVADDNRDALESLAMLLECGGHEVCKAADGAEAFELAASWRPDLALLDIGMPSLDGYEVARRIRAQSWGRSMTLIALSGWGQSEDMRRSTDAGFDLHLVKPLNMDALADVFGRFPSQANSGAAASH
jgi:CheY-like chemotaxis protein